MAQKTRLRHLALAAALVPVISLGGCFLLPTRQDSHEAEPTPTEASSNALAQVGDCWEADFVDMADWSSWEGEGPIDCSERHQAYTYFVDELEDDIEDGWDGAYMSQELATAISEKCDAVLAEDFEWEESQGRLMVFFFTTTKREWVDGDHSFRCDIGLIESDSDYYSPKLDDLPDIADLRHDLADNPEAYELCLLGDGLGPYDSYELTVADCGGDYLWRLAGSLDYPAGPGEKYPADDTVYQYALDQCARFDARADETVLPYVPNLEMWDAGDRVIECWYSLVEQPSSAV